MRNKVKLKVHNFLGRNQTSPKEEKDINEIFEFRDHPRLLLTLTGMYHLWKVLSFSWDEIRPSLPHANVASSNNWYRVEAQEYLLKECPVAFYLMSPKSSREKDPPTVAFPIMCCAFCTYNNTVKSRLDVNQFLLGMSALTFSLLPPTLHYKRLWKSDLLVLEHS